jgi:hypothetical protein
MGTAKHTGKGGYFCRVADERGLPVFPELPFMSPGGMICNYFDGEKTAGRILPDKVWRLTHS